MLVLSLELALLLPCRRREFPLQRRPASSASMSIGVGPDGIVDWGLEDTEDKKDKRDRKGQQRREGKEVEKKGTRERG